MSTSHSNQCGETLVDPRRGLWDYSILLYLCQSRNTFTDCAVYSRRATLRINRLCVINPRLSRDAAAVPPAFVGLD